MSTHRRTSANSLSPNKLAIRKQPRIHLKKMPEAREHNGDSFIFQPKCMEGKDYLQKLSPEFARRTMDKMNQNPLCVSASSSICNSDDSGIGRTLNMASSSPLLCDTDSEDSNSLDGFHLSSGRSTEESFGKSLGTKLYNQPSNITQVSQAEVTGRIKRLKPQKYDAKISETKNDNRFHILSYEQVFKLTQMLTTVIPIHSRCPGYPTVWLRLNDLFQLVRENLQSVDIPVKGIKLNGGAASHIIGMDPTANYNDIDVLFLVDLSSHSSTIQRVKSAVLDALMRFLPGLTQTNAAYAKPSDFHSEISTREALSTNLNAPFCGKPVSSWTRFRDPVYCSNNYSSSDTQTSRPDLPISSDSCQLQSNGDTGANPAFSAGIFTPSPNSSASSLSSFSPSTDVKLRESYIYKQFRKYSTHETDCWSLISLGMPSPRSKVVELKFVDRMKRQFEFTVDSFQIHIDSVLKFLEINDPNCLNANYFPTVVAESVAGAYAEAVHHLKNKLIHTREPEMIRGGGLLKYCRLLVNGYQAPEGIDVGSLERYMSSRFFIDFQDIESQKAKIEAFLSNHFAEDEYELKISFLHTVHRVVSGSSICLMSFERYQTLNLIYQLINQITEKAKPKAKSISLEWLADQQKLTIDRIYLGNQLFPLISRDATQAFLYVCENDSGAGTNGESSFPASYKTDCSLSNEDILTSSAKSQSRCSSESFDF